MQRLWHGTPPAEGGTVIGPPSLLLVPFAGTDQMLVVSVVYGEIAALHAPGDGRPVLHTAPLFGTGLRYVAGVLAAADATALQAFAADGEPLWYHYVEPVRQ